MDTPRDTRHGRHVCLRGGPCGVEAYFDSFTPAIAFAPDMVRKTENNFWGERSFPFLRFSPPSHSLYFRVSGSVCAASLPISQIKLFKFKVSMFEANLEVTLRLTLSLTSSIIVSHLCKNRS